MVDGAIWSTREHGLRWTNHEASKHRSVIHLRDQGSSRASSLRGQKQKRLGRLAGVPLAENGVLSSSTTPDKAQEASNQPTCS